MKIGAIGMWASALALAATAIAIYAAPASGYPTLTPINHSYGEQMVGTSSLPFTFTLNVKCQPDPPNPAMCSNPAGEPLTPNVTVTGEFAVVNDNCSGMLMPGASTVGTNCTFGVVFSPGGVGSRSGLVDVGDPLGFARGGVTGIGFIPLSPPPLIQAPPGTTTSVTTTTAKKKCKRKRTAAASKKKCKKKK